MCRGRCGCCEEADSSEIDEGDLKRGAYGRHSRNHNVEGVTIK